MVRNDTICAVATAAGSAGVAIVRISGRNAKAVLEKIFTHKEELLPRRMTLGTVHDGEKLIDRALGVFFAAPASFTGEDVAEVHVHGGELVTRLVLRAAVNAGAVPAQPGEFSKRAFLNGKMDVSQAEAVQELIFSMSEKGAEISARNLRGDLFARITELQNRLKDVLAALQAGIEYPEEDLEEALACEQMPHVQKTLCGVERLIETFEQGRTLREGIRVAIAGRTNVGKSSLLNAILGEERAIVTDIPGTTRDVLTEHYSYRGVPLIFFDTAGLRQTQDAVERIGIERAKELLKTASVALVLFDASVPVGAEEKQLFAELQTQVPFVIPVLNKTDLAIRQSAQELEGQIGCRPVCVSAATGAGVDDLLARIYSCAVRDAALTEGVTITSERHRDVLVRAKQSLQDALTALQTGVSLDCVTIDLTDAWQALGEITGQTLTEEIIDRIFDSFCLGK